MSKRTCVVISDLSRRVGRDCYIGDSYFCSALHFSHRIQSRHFYRPYIFIAIPNNVAMLRILLSSSSSFLLEFDVGHC